MIKTKPGISPLCLVLILFNTVACYAYGQQVKPKILESGYIFDTAEFKACHASTIVQSDNGRIMAAWFGGDHEGSPDVCVWMSAKKADSWTKPVKVADGIQPGGKQYACWNPVLFKTKNGKLYLHYKVGPNPREWWAMYKVSHDNGDTWSEATRLPDGFLGPIKDKPIQLDNNKILYPSSVESRDEKQWTIHLELSDNNAEHWQIINLNCDTFGVIQPTILTYPGHKLQLLARSRQNVIVQSWSFDNGINWTPVTKINLPNPNSGIDAVSLVNHLQLLVYNPLPAGKNWWEGRSVLKLGMSKDGLNWTDIYTLEDNKTGEYSYPAIIQDDAGNIHITYTDNRKRIKYIKLKLE
jgi:alpha-L-fucosidase